MASGPIISWEIKGENVETVSDFIFLGSKITIVGDCNHEIKRNLLLGWEDPLEEGMATYFSILAWRIPMDRGTWQAAVNEFAKSQT